MHRFVGSREGQVACTEVRGRVQSRARLAGQGLCGMVHRFWAPAPILAWRCDREGFLSTHGGREMYEGAQNWKQAHV